ncbi:hypothetical protein [Bradyrhizobium sp. CB2312]|uniref:hypothetical protein n=1 Tax=Bradyrhizobium sp. CB2312 TaxID=3039155 RepID=UPI0024B20636|nr:hypothetical protein [Bradyrhizobium sp. CB2312]WFU69440.1 hypothetical protein QA642_29680 [Bradyrhizobium sp. CB2312]
MNYFHLTPIRLAPGSIVQPGNWGRIIRKYQSPSSNLQTFGNAWLMARELIFESVRAAQFSAKPSRLDAAFCCLDEASARAYQNQADGAQIQTLHEVELVDPTKPTHQAPLPMVDYPPPMTPFIEQTTLRAVQYWSGDPNGNQEIVTLSPLRVVRALD